MASFFGIYPYPLHPFQKHSLEAIVDGQHVLVCAPTGSGKTLPGEFAIQHFVSRGKKVIYTTPIKALSNQKLHDFREKYPHISFGLLTGDLKCNPDADCLIMTTEILLNKLYVTNKTEATPATATASFVSFDMDIQRELACVVFDEVHYINDEARGHVWEQTLMLLPSHVQRVMLSATLDDPLALASWCETVAASPDKQVNVVTQTKRAVPLTHYSFLTTPAGLFKTIKDKTIQEDIKSNTQQLHVLQSAQGRFDEGRYHTIQRMKQLFTKASSTHSRQQRAHVLNQVAKHCVEKDMLPALCFVFSRKQLEACAHELTTVLLPDDSKVPYVVRRECEHILRRLPNFEEYLRLPEYQDMVHLLEKGIGMHHAGLLAPLREMVELLFAKGYIQWLFCTETLSIGINMPVKTAVFTSLEKFDGHGKRWLYSHEYTQAAGRAGRLGLDTVGHVVHLNNLFPDTLDKVTYRDMLGGRPQKLTSQFQVSFPLLLTWLRTHVVTPLDSLVVFARQSLLQRRLGAQTDALRRELEAEESVLSASSSSSDHTEATHVTAELWQDYTSWRTLMDQVAPKKRKEWEALRKQVETDHPQLAATWEQAQEMLARRRALEVGWKELHDQDNLFRTTLVHLCRLLEEHGFVTDTNQLTPLGHIAAQLREVPCLAVAGTLLTEAPSTWTAEDWVSYFACFASVTVPEDRAWSQSSSIRPAPPASVLTEIRRTETERERWREHDAHARDDDAWQFDLFPYARAWCDCSCEADCHALLRRMEEEKDMYLGEFVKALLKINNIAREMEPIAEAANQLFFLQQLRRIPDLTLKYVVTQQSLYV